MSLELKNLIKSFHNGSHSIEVLKGAQLKLTKGDRVAILGPSGCGKSTLLSLIAGLDQPNQGEVWLEGECLTTLSEKALSQYRARHLGIVFQQFHLMPHLTALENVSLPLELARDKEALSKAKKLLEEVGLKEREQHFPSQLSGGESQRVAIARALATEPGLILADEPTGNLDEETGIQIADVLFKLAQTKGTTLVVVTHNQELAMRCNRRFHLNQGLLHEVLA